MIEPDEEMNIAYWAAVNNTQRTRSSTAPHREGLAAVLAIVERDQQASARKGYETAIAVLRGVAERTGSPAAAWCADYLLVDPDRLAPPPL